LTDLVDENRIDWPAVGIEEIVDVEELKSRKKCYEKCLKFSKGKDTRR
jgi:hypothetical protein